MSWWDTSKGLSSFASQALKSAQQKIDKVLDIKDGEQGGGAAASSSISTPLASSACTSASDIQPQEISGGDNGGGEEFWNNWLGSDVGFGNSPLFSGKTSNTSRKTDTEVYETNKTEVISTSTTTTKKLSKMQLKKQVSSLESVEQRSSEQSSLPTEGKFESVSLSPVSGNQDTSSSKPDSPSVMEEKQDLVSGGKKRAPLKLGLKSKSKEKLEKDKEKETSAAVEEMIKRQKEAEDQLLEMLGGDASKEAAASDVTTKVKESKPLITESKNEVKQGENVKRLSQHMKAEPLEEIQEEKTKTDEGTVPKSNLDNAGPIESENLTSRLEVQMSESAVSLDINQSDWGEASLLTDSQLMTVSDGVTSSQSTEDSDGVTNSQPTENNETLPKDKTVHDTTSDKIETNCVIKDNETENELILDQCKNVAKSEDNENIIEASDDLLIKDSSEKDDVKQENTALEVTRDESSDNESENVEASPPKDESSNNVEASTQELSLKVENATDEKESIPSIQSSCSMLSTLDGSLSSENVDDLSSSNQTLTAEDFQSSIHSNKSSDKDIDKDDIDSSSVSQTVENTIDNTDANVNSGSDKALSSGITTSSQDIPCVHTTADNPPEEPSVQPKERSSTLESNQSTGSSNKSDTIQSPQSMTASHSSQCSSSSYVKNMLEEAMVESMKDLDSRSDSVSHSSSDMVRIESDQNSGHTSGDDLETATSSDIEIISHISTPTPNGENRGFGIGVDRPFDLSPLRHALNKAVRSPPSHKRTDSGSSAYSMQSKNGDELTSPVEPARREEVHKKPQQAEANNDPFEKEKLLKEESTAQQLQPISEGAESSNDNNQDVNKLLEKLAEMAEVLEAREKKLVDLSRQNMDLVEANSIIKNQLQQSEETREAEMTDLNQLTEEFTKRISDAERRFNQAAKESDQLRKKLQETETALIKRSDISSTAEKLINEKDTQINELLTEGEKLSKQQLQSNNVIKKLRSKEKENESLLKTQKDKMESQKAEIERLKKVLDNKCDVEKTQTESINQLQNLIKRQEKELEKYKSEWEEAQEKVRSMESALDKSYKEIAELHKANVTKATERQEAALSHEIHAKQELQLNLDRFQLQAKQEQEALIYQIEDLRLSISRMEKEHGRREDVLRQEISDLQQRLQDGEDRNQELTSSVTAATRPLLRQIENLQSTYTAQSSSYEKVEKNLTDRLSEAQMQLATAQEKERVATEQLMDLQTKITSYETQLSSLRQDKSRLQAQLEMEKTKVEVLEDAKNKESAQKETLQHSLESRLSELKKEKLLLENQLEMEKMKVESEKKKLLLAHEQIRDKELQLSQIKTTSRSSTPNDLRRESMESPNFNSIATSMSQSFLSQQSDDLERSFVFTPSKGATSNNHHHSATSLYESLRHTGAASFMENLQSQLKQKDGEIVQLQSEIHELERTRESMARELVNVTNANQELEVKVQELPEAINKYKELDQRYNALLQMYGEKVEEAQELRLDLQDVKDLYKNQIDELLQKS